MLRIIFSFFCIKKAKFWKRRKSRLEIATEPGKSSTRRITFRVGVNLTKNEVEREISERSECSRKLKYSGLGWRRYPRALKTCFLNSTMIICLHFSRSTSVLVRFTPTRKVILLVEDFPGFVGISNLVFRVLREFIFGSKKKISSEISSLVFDSPRNKKMWTYCHDMYPHWRWWTFTNLYTFFQNCEIPLLIPW